MATKIISVFGGMCYTIYLIHSPIISAFSRVSQYFKVSDNFVINLLINTIICLPIITVASAIFFRYVEKPCMDKNWPKKLVNYFRGIKVFQSGA